MNNYHRLMLGVSLIALATGCTPSATQPEMHVGNTNSTTTTTTTAAPVSAVTGLPSLAPSPGTPTGMAMPDKPAGMMTQDPRSITEVEGKIVEVHPTEMFVQKGSVTLKFHLSPATKIKPDGKTLAAGQEIKILIEQVADGMSAKEIDIK